MEEIHHLFMRHACEDGRVCNLVSVQMQNRKNCTVADRIQELIALPGGGKRAGLRLAVTNGNSGNQIRIIEYSSECMRNGIAELTALVDGAGSLRCAVRRNAARERELLEQLLHSVNILRDVRIDLAVGAVKVIIGNIEVSAMSGTGKKDQVQIVSLNGTVQMYKYKVLSGNGSPVSDNFLLHHIHGQRLLKKRVVQKIQLACRKVIGRTPVSIHLCEKLVSDGSLFLADSSREIGITHIQSPYS